MSIHVCWNSRRRIQCSFYTRIFLSSFQNFYILDYVLIITINLHELVCQEDRKLEIIKVELNTGADARRNKKLFKDEMRAKRKSVARNSSVEDESRRLSLEDPLFKSMALALGGGSGRDESVL